MSAKTIHIMRAGLNLPYQSANAAFGLMEGRNRIKGSRIDNSLGESRGGAADGASDKSVVSHLDR